MLFCHSNSILESLSQLSLQSGQFVKKHTANYMSNVTLYRKSEYQIQCLLFIYTKGKNINSFNCTFNNKKEHNHYQQKIVFLFFVLSIAWFQNLLHCCEKNYLLKKILKQKIKEEGTGEETQRGFCLFVNFFFWSHCMPCRILVLRPGIKPVPSEVEAWSLNHWNARAVLRGLFICLLLMSPLRSRKQKAVYRYQILSVFAFLSWNGWHV